jgi:hypothetical protein
MYLAEGSNASMPDKQHQFAQSGKNHHVLEAFHMLCAMTGRAFSTSKSTISDMSSVNIRQSELHAKPYMITKVPYAGSVWCPTTPSGAWVMRHNGAIVMTGNSRKQVPFIAKHIMEHPGGRYAQLIRAENRSQTQGDLAPDYVRDTASIPVDPNNPVMSAIFGTPPKGTDRYLSGFGLMHEDAMSFSPGARGAALEAMSRMNPLIKAPLELATGQTFFQRGPEGGRDLDKLDPALGRIMANVGNMTGLRTSDKAVKLPIALESIASNSPFARGITTLRTLTDQRKGSNYGVLPVKAPGPSALINTLTGARVTDVSPAAKDAVVRELLQSAEKKAGAATFERINFRKEDLAAMSPSQRKEADRLQLLSNILAKRAKTRKKDKEKAKA